MDFLILVNEDNSLSRNYVPENLVVINEPTGFKDDPSYVNKLNKEAYVFFKQMQKEALEQGYEIFIDSSYRSYEYQKELFRKAFFEKGLLHTLDYLAAPGESEHQTGLAIDIIPRRNNTFIENANHLDPELVWCMENCHKYGYILRYPEGFKDITGFNFEPWHYRYIGKEHSMNMYEKDIKTLEEYVKPKVKVR